MRIHYSLMEVYFLQRNPLPLHLVQSIIAYVAKVTNHDHNFDPATGMIPHLDTLHSR